MRLTYSIVAGALMLAIGLLSPRASAQAALPATPPRVAVANVVKIFNENQWTKDLKTKADADAKALDNERIARQAKIRDLQAQRNQIVPSAPDFQKIQNQLLQESINLKNWIDFQKLEMDRQQKQQIKDVFDRITATIAKYAAANKIDIVISDQQPEIPADLDTINIDQLRVGLIQRSLLYSGNQWDISDAIITLMDKEYKGG